MNVVTTSFFRQTVGRRWLGVLVLVLSAAVLHVLPTAAGQSKAEQKPAATQGGDGKAASAPKKAKKHNAAKAKKRAESVRALLAHLKIGEGSVVADIGAGNGQDTWVFADIVGEKGTVFAEEVVESKVKSLEGQIKKKDLSQVRVVLGSDLEAGLPQDAVDLAFMRYVYHHCAKPREMLRAIWSSLKPGGYLVVVDRHRGTLRDWIPREKRKAKHFWIAETTVVREAREEGFAFVECAEEHWQASEPFVLVFRRPDGLKEPGRDPDALLPLPKQCNPSPLLPPSGRYQRPVFIALGESRRLIEPILQKSSGEGLEIVLEEWATRKDERPPLPAGVSLPSVLTEKGDPHLGEEPIDAVFFLDSYHLLFHGKTLLAKIHEKLLPNGCVYVLDRGTSQALQRREASHHRRISPETVQQEMKSAGFFLRSTGPQLAPDRFLLVFGKCEKKDKT